jgi:hypothetical protein
MNLKPTRLGLCTTSTLEYPLQWYSILSNLETYKRDGTLRATHLMLKRESNQLCVMAVRRSLVSLYLDV